MKRELEREERLSLMLINEWWILSDSIKHVIDKFKCVQCIDYLYQNCSSGVVGIKV